MDILIWAILIVVFVILELCTVQLVSIWLAAASLITMICAAVFDDMPLLGQFGVFVVTSAVMLCISVPLIRKRLNREHIATNSELNVGKSAEVIEEINADKNSGRVTLNGVDWSAVSEKGDVISKDSIVTVTAVTGSKLVVKLKV
ncbi:MAG: NfeD family protein [Ruminococcus sp.]|nr:NfeD family protein [Ruminococcus sp.]